jgi:hypothetical protein
VGEITSTASTGPGQIVLGEVGVPGHQDVGLNLVELVRAHRERSGQDPELSGTGLIQQYGQCEHHRLVRPAWRRAHQELSVDKFVPATVIRHPLQVGDREGVGDIAGTGHDCHGPLLS